MVAGGLVACCDWRGCDAGHGTPTLASPALALAALATLTSAATTCPPPAARALSEESECGPATSTSPHPAPVPAGPGPLPSSHEADQLSGSSRDGETSRAEVLLCCTAPGLDRAAVTPRPRAPRRTAPCRNTCTVTVTVTGV